MDWALFSVLILGTAVWLWVGRMQNKGGKWRAQSVGSALRLQMSKEHIDIVTEVQGNIAHWASCTESNISECMKASVVIVSRWAMACSGVLECRATMSVLILLLAKWLLNGCDVCECTKIRCQIQGWRSQSGWYLNSVWVAGHASAWGYLLW